MERADRSHRRRGRWGRLLLFVAVAALAVPALPSVPHGVGPSAEVVGPSDPLPPAYLAGSWSTFHGSENRSGFSATVGPAHGSILWDAAPTGSTAFPIRAGLVLDPTDVYASDDLGTVFAFNRTTNGTIDWRQPIGGTLTAPEVWGPELAVGSAAGAVEAVARATGAVLWSTSVGGGVVQGLGESDGTLYAPTTNGEIVAVNASTGGITGRYPLGAAAAGAVAVEGTDLVAVTTNGSVLAFTIGGGLLWRASVGEPVRTAPAVSEGRVVVADTGGNVTAFELANGTVAWQWVGRAAVGGESFLATPALGLGGVFLDDALGGTTALSLANGALLWRANTSYAGYPELSSPVLAPNGLYVASSSLDILDLDPSTGRTIWETAVGFEPSYPAPAMGDGTLYVGDDLGAVLAIGAAGGPPRFPVTGTVVDPNGTPIPGASVTTEGHLAVANGTGGFLLVLANGSYALTATDPGFVPTVVLVNVSGPTSGIVVVLTPVPVVLVRGTVLNEQSRRAVANATVFVIGSGLTRSSVTGPDGSFQLAAPIGLDFFTVSGPPGYGGSQVHFDVPAGGLTGLILTVPPTVPGPNLWPVAGGLAALGLATAFVGLWAAARRRAELGQPRSLFSPFAQYITMRVAMLPVQIVATLAILFLFGTILPAIFFNVRPCQLSAWACAPGGWGNPANATAGFFGGFGAFIWDMFTGQWGSTSYGALTEPAHQFLAWWLPNSIQLALLALPLSAAIAYPVGLYVGAHQERGADVGVRLASVVALLTPTFLVVLLFLGVFYEPFTARLGDSPYGILPALSWYSGPGGPPHWIGLADTTSPTSLPIVDGAIHGDWPFVEVVFLKTFWQAAIIALVYVAIFLRFARQAVAEAFREPHLRATRSRGVSESSLLWHHTGRRVIPLFLLVFGITLPIYIGTQAVVEALADDPGVGTLLISQMTHVTQSGFGTHALFPAQHPGSLYQVMIFGLVAVVLLGNLLADVAARYFDPRLLRGRS